VHAGTITVESLPERVLILKHYFSLKLFADVCKHLAMPILTRMYPIKQQHPLLTTFWERLIAVLSKLSQ
jgi:hypothetical protein